MWRLENAQIEASLKGGVLTIARLNAPEDWQGELRSALRARQAPPSIWARDGDVRLFLESFAIFFVATMMFLI